MTAPLSCPCCGAQLAEGRAPVALSDIVIEGPKGRMLALLSARMGRFVTRDALFDAAYGADPDGGPESANTIAVHICKLKRRLEPHGWTIVSTSGGRGVTASYRLAPLMPEPQGAPGKAVKP